MRRHLTAERRWARFWAAVVVASALAAGCGQPDRAPETIPRRLIAIAPNVVEIIYELGLGERLVGVGNHCSYPPEVAHKPKVGGLLDPRLEQIVLLDPDLAILLPSEESLAADLEGLGIEVLTVPIETVTDISTAMERIGTRTGVEDDARTAAEKLRALTERPLLSGGPRALLIVDRQPGALADIYAAARGTFLDELLMWAGGVNVLADAPLRYPAIGLEEVLSRSPEVIVELQARALDPSTREALAADWLEAGSPEPPCVVVLEGEHVLIPGPRVEQLYHELVAALRECGGAGA